MAGGSGTRLWPASRSTRPKQYLPLAGQQTMLAATAARLEGLVEREHVIVVTAEGQAALVRESLPWLLEENLLVEPEARNTAACVAWAACHTAAADPDAVQLVLPADHLIEPPDRFRATLAAGAAVAASSAALVTFGVEPDHPATGYGYIERGEDAGPEGGVRVSRFVEKPDLERAKEFLASGRFLWNAGIFAWTGRSILAAFDEFEPSMRPALEAVVRGEQQIGEVYGTLPAKPVDTAILERSSDVRVLPIDYSWNDVGSWAALADVAKADAAGNWPILPETARLVTEASKGNVVWSDDPDAVIALVGVDDLVVVRAGNATLVCPRDRAQEVKRIVEQLKASAQGAKHL